MSKQRKVSGPDFISSRRSDFRIQDHHSDSDSLPRNGRQFYRHNSIGHPIITSRNQQHDDGLQDGLQNYKNHPEASSLSKIRSRKGRKISNLTRK